MDSIPLTIDINSDVGESYGAFRIGADEQLFPLISSANVACGFHGGDPVTMERTVRALVEQGVVIGAHPSFPDLQGFGRRNILASAAQIRTDVIYQIGALLAFCQVERVPLHHVKPHGALYNMAARDETIADAIAGAVYDLVPDALVYALPESNLESAAKSRGLRVARECFADRAYLSDGTLAPRSLPDSVLTDPAAMADRVVRMIRKEAFPTLDGGQIVVDADTVCIHSDTPTAVEIASALHRALDRAAITIRPV